MKLLELLLAYLSKGTNTDDADYIWNYLLRFLCPLSYVKY